MLQAVTEFTTIPKMIPTSNEKIARMYSAFAAGCRVASDPFLMKYSSRLLLSIFPTTSATDKKTGRRQKQPVHPNANESPAMFSITPKEISRLWNGYVLGVVFPFIISTTGGTSDDAGGGKSGREIEPIPTL
tara:strand:+ start:54089 stop:54484 length:396 start_codon:yes stop_codon:yes gene_type:complete